jgi:hypothetical protein
MAVEVYRAGSRAAGTEICPQAICTRTDPRAPIQGLRVCDPYRMLVLLYLVSFDL